MVLDNKIKVISCGARHCSALRVDGSLVSWGKDDFGQVSNTPPGNDFIQVSCGWNHCTALRNDGSLVSWGNNIQNVVSDTPQGNDFIQVSCGSMQTTALKSDGTLVAWGHDEHGQVSNIPIGNDFIQVSCGYLNNVALRNNGELVSWGRNWYGSVLNTPQDNNFVQVSFGSTHATALTTEGTLISWGYSVHGAVSNTPQGNDFIQVSCGHDHCTALRNDGSLISWGIDYNQYSDYYYYTVSGTPEDNNFIQVSCGELHCLVLRNDGTLTSWGNDQYGEINGTPTNNGFGLPMIDEDDDINQPTIEGYINLMATSKLKVPLFNIDDVNISYNKLRFFTNKGILCANLVDVSNQYASNLKIMTKHGIKSFSLGIEQIIPEDPEIPEDPSIIPGSTEFIGGDENAGFLGEVESNELFTGAELSQLCDIWAGMSMNDDVDWLKFMIDGKILFRPKKPFRTSITYPHLLTRGCVYGEKIVSKNNVSYKVRLMKGTLTDPPDYESFDRGALASEWNKLMLPIHENSIDNSWQFPQYVEESIQSWSHSFGSGVNGMYSDEDIGYDIAGSVLCQEIYPDPIDDIYGPWVVGRKNEIISFLEYDLSSGRLWLPVLEVVETS